MYIYKLVTLAKRKFSRVPIYECNQGWGKGEEAGMEKSGHFFLYFSISEIYFLKIL